MTATGGELVQTGVFHKMRSCPARRFGVPATTILAYYLHPRMLPKPLGESVHAADCKDMHQHVTFEIY